MFSTGDKVSWKTLNGRAHGTLLDRLSDDSQTWNVKMDSGRNMLVHETSMTPDKE